MNELIICPNCGEPTIEMRRVYEHESKKKKTTLEQYAKREVELEKKQGSLRFVFGASEMPYELSKSIQLVFQCKNCGYTKSYDI